MENDFKFTGKFIGFDFDGTLADSLTMYLDIYNEIAKEKGYREATLRDEEILRTSMVSLTDLIKFTGNFGIGLMHFPMFIKNFFARLDKYRDKMLIFPGIPELLADLHAKGYIIYLITSNQQEIVAQFLKDKKLDQFFTGIYALDFFGNKGKKLHELTQDLRIEPGQFIYIGDEVRDIEAARKAGLQVISVTWGLNSPALLEKYTPDAIAGNLDELRHLLKLAY